MRKPVAVVLTALVAASLSAQQPPLVTQQQPLVESIEVRVASIDVVVRDRSGHQIVGLTKDDFELYQDDVLQPLTNFYEIRRGEEAGGAQPPVELRQRRTLFFFDCASLTPTRKRNVMESIRRYIETMRPEDRAMIVAWRMGLHVVTPFTNDRAVLQKGLEDIARIGPAGEGSDRAAANLRRQVDDLVETVIREENETRPLLTWEEAYAQSNEMVKRYAIQLEAQQGKLLDAITQASEAMAGTEGKRVLVFVGQTLAGRPGSELYRYINKLMAPHLNRNEVTELDLEMENTGPTTDNILATARAVAANGVTLYAISAAIADGNVSSESKTVIDSAYMFVRDANTASALQSLASTTGGVAISHTDNFDLAFDTIDRDLSSYYSLGYKPTPGGHHIVVKPKNKAYVVRTRDTFVSKSTDDQMTDRVVSNLYVDPTRNEWPIALRVGHPQSEGKGFLVPVQVVIPSTITLLPQSDGNLAGSFTLYFAAATADGATSPVLRRPQTFSIVPTAEQTMRAKPMTFTTALRMKPGESTLSVAIVDQYSGQSGFARTTVAVHE